MDHESKIVCDGLDCHRKDVYSKVAEIDLKQSDLKEGSCLIDTKTEKAFYLMEVGPSTKVVMLSEKDDYVLERNIVFFDSKEFNRKLKRFPCEQVSGVMGNMQELQKCIKTNGKTVHNLFCEKPRISNF
jgi:hypothetical protein